MSFVSAKFAAIVRSAALVSAVALIPATTASMAQVDGKAAPEFARLFATYQQIKANYVEDVDDETLIRGAIDGMLASLDPHSSFLDGSDLQRLNTMIDGNYSGLGLSVVMDDGAVKINSPFRGSPADKAAKARELIDNPSAENRRALIEMVRSSDAVEYAIATARDFADQAIDHLNVVPDSPARGILAEMAEFACQRSF